MWWWGHILFADRASAGQMLVLFNTQVMLLLGNELWNYGSSSGAYLNDMFLILSGASFMFSHMVTGTRCHQAWLTTIVSSTLATSYAIAMSVAVYAVYRAKEPPTERQELSLGSRRHRAFTKQVVVGIVMLFILLSALG